MNAVALTLAAAAVALGTFFYRELAWEFSYWRAPRPPAAGRLNLPACPNCNVILLSMDTLRADFAEQAQNLRAIAQESVAFEAAYTNAFYTSPSHMTVFTSLFPNRHRVTGTGVHVPRWPRTSEQAAPLEAKYTTAAEVARAQGYFTHWFAPLRLKHLDRDLGFGRGFERFSPPLFARPGRAAGFDAAAWTTALQERRPFFYFVHSYVTHLPYFLPEHAAEFPLLFGEKQLIENYFRMSKRAEGLPAACGSPLKLGGCLSEASMADTFLHDLGQFQLWTMEKVLHGVRKRRSTRQREALRRAYGESALQFDRQLGEWWSLFKKSGRGKDTLVVLFSDHGEELYEHGHGSHSSFYQHTARVPLILFHPKLEGAVKVAAPVSLVDVLPTLISLLQWPALGQAQGQDLNRFTEARPVFGYSLGNDFVTDGQWKLIRGPNGAEEIYFLPGDPGERRNLASYRWPRITREAARLREERRRWELEQAL